MALQNVRNRYVSDGAGTVSQARLLVMLYDRLVLDIEHAGAAIATNSLEVVNDKLCHAQAIVIELRGALDHDAWDGAANLDSIYVWLDSQLTRANIKKDAEAITGCLKITQELREAWHGAYAADAAEKAARMASGVPAT